MRLDRGNLGHVVQLAPLAPDSVEEILDGQHPAELGLHKFMQPLPVEYKEQRTAFAEAASRKPPAGALNRS